MMERRLAHMYMKPSASALKLASAPMSISSKLQLEKQWLLSSSRLGGSMIDFRVVNASY